MPKTYTITAKDAEEISKLRKGINDKQVDKRLRAIQLRGEGKKNKEIAKMLETSSDVISIWISEYAKGGAKAVLPKKRGGNHRNMSFEEEASLLATFESRADAGELVETSEIKEKYQEKCGHVIGSGQIYVVLARHQWRKVKPRSKHPKKAAPEVIETSKKLTLELKN